MNNKPKYTIFKNSMYAFEGLIHAIKTETSFKLELFFGFFIIPAIIFLPITLSYKLILFVTFFIILITELLNSAVENVVDLVTQDIHPLAKTAKDLGATAVLFSVILHIVCWIFILIEHYY
jgi:diacylglycerol kinase (ATP)